MRAALALARRGLGNVWPNPAVGCVLVRPDSDVVVGRGWTQPGGRPHAETEALRRAGGAARGAGAFVTLEPCSHHGRTPPCVDALIAAGVARVVMAVEDPDPRVAGCGARALAEAGLAVETGLLETEGRDLNAGFLLRVGERRPLVTLKCATSLDGRIATRRGHSQWITGDAARRRGHLLRAQHDAVLTGIGTVLADDPRLTCRLPGLPARTTVRVVADSALRLPLDSVLVRGIAEDGPLWVVTAAGERAERRAALEAAGAEVIAVEADVDGRPSLAALLRVLADRGITRVLLEAGAALAGAAVAADVVDRVAWFRAPSLIGGDGLPALAAFGVDRLAESPSFVRRGLDRLGHDLLESYRRAP